MTFGKESGVLYIDPVINILLFTKMQKMEYFGGTVCETLQTDCVPMISEKESRT